MLKACRAGGLRLISSTLLHFGKASELALHSASATPGIASELALLSLCAMVKVQGSRFKTSGQWLVENFSLAAIAWRWMRVALWAQNLKKIPQKSL